MEAGLASSKTRAQALILAGRILVNDVPIDKAGRRVAEDVLIRLKGGPPARYVSRGGDKLAGALEDLGVDPTGHRCLDVGASTGGFTDCLLQHGAREVVAIDVGRGQLHARLRADPRVRIHERVNGRALGPEHVEGPVDLVVADVSFISLRLLLGAFARVAPGADWILLVKPQFEVGRDRVGRGGVVRDDAVRQSAVEDVVEASSALGYSRVAQADSRLAGPKGNREIFVQLRPAAGESDVDCGTLAG